MNQSVSPSGVEHQAALEMDRLARQGEPISVAFGR